MTLVVPRQASISIQSTMTVYLETSVGGKKIGHGTGFIAKSQAGKTFVITSRHVITGRHAFTNQPLCEKPSQHQEPQQLTVFFHKAGFTGVWESKKFELFDDCRNRTWFEHPDLLEKCDIAAIEIDETGGLFLPAFLPSSNLGEHQFGVMDMVTIVGFPLGRSVSEKILGMDVGVPFWIHGTIASEPSLDFGNRPIFCIDSKSQKGQSGSPVGSE